MTLEMAIRDWQQRLDEQAAEIERLRAERDAWRTLVLENNAKVDLLERAGCDVALSYCLWPMPSYFRIDIPPELEPKP